MRSKQILYAAAVLCGVLLVSWAAGLKSDVAALRDELAKVKAESAARSEVSPKDLRLARAERIRLAREAISSDPSAARNTPQELQQARIRIAELEDLVSELSAAWSQFTEDEESRRAAAAIQEWSAQQAAGPLESPSDGNR